MTIPAYPKIHALGNKGTDLVYRGRAIVQEKTDGSQFGFGIDAFGNFSARSKRVQLDQGTLDQNFGPSIRHLQQQDVQDALMRLYQLHGPVFFYGEAVARPRHNTLVYDGVPKGNIVLFDALIGGRWVEDMDVLMELAEGLGVAPVPILHDTDDNGPLSLEQIISYANSRSFLDSWNLGLQPKGVPAEGGVTMEGVVIKNYGQTLDYNGMAQPCFVKLVRPEFKERNNANPDHQKQGGITGYLDGFASERFWEKVLEHARDEGVLTGSLQDIGPLMKRLVGEVEEDRDTYAQELYEIFRKDITRAAGRGFADWYKARLIEESDNKNDECD